MVAAFYLMGGGRYSPQETWTELLGKNHILWSFMNGWFLAA
jgi:hypothetical protein